jgi:hypothetical protein
MSERGAVARIAFLCVASASAVSVSAQSLSFARVGSIAGPADMVKVQDRYAYIVADKTVSVVDISNPAAPRREGAYTFPDRIWGFSVAGSFVYVADDLAGFGILDVSNPAAPALRGSFKTRGQAHGVAVYGTKALIADHMAGVVLVDASNPANPVAVDSFFLEGYPRDVVARGALAYAVDSPTGFYVFDLSKSGPLEPASALQSANGRALGVSEGAPGANIANIVCVAGGAALQVFDVTHPAAPVLTATYRTPGRPQRVSLQGRLAYVADGPAGLQVVDLSMPSTPRLIGAHATSAPARDVAIASSLVLVVVGNEEVLLLRQTP